METLFIIGRILFGGYLIMNGVNHFYKMEMMTNYASSKGVPKPGLAVGITGVMLLLSGIGFLLWIYVEFAIWLIVVFLLVVSFKMHAFWKIKDSMQKMPEMVNFMKNMALLGAALIVLHLL